MAKHSITLVNPAFGVYVAHPSPPLGLAYLKAALEKNGIPAVLVDETAGMSITPESIETEWVGISVFTPTAKMAYEMADAFRAIGKKVVLGGPHVSILPKEALRHADKVIVGEGEKSILEIFSSKKKVISSLLIKDIDSILFPDWHGLPLEKYTAPTRKHAYLKVMTSRGCPWGCVYCFKGVFGRCYRMRSFQNVVDEVEALQAEYGTREIAFIDDNFSQNRERTVDICREILQRRIKIDWACPNGVRVDTMDLPLLKLMKKAGCYQLSFGVESGNQEVLDKIGKGIKLEQVENAVGWAKEAGIETIGFFMIGLPFDNEKTMQQTIDFAKKLPLDLVQFTVTVPYPGTELYGMVEKKGRFLVEDWSAFGSYSGKAYYEFGALDKDLVERMYKKAYKEVYFRPGYALKRVAKNPKLLLSGVKYFSAMFGKKN
ncbi:MAG: radical SAM protein [archaeon]